MFPQAMLIKARAELAARGFHGVNPMPCEPTALELAAIQAAAAPQPRRKFGYNPLIEIEREQAKSRTVSGQLSLIRGGRGA